MLIFLIATISAAQIDCSEQKQKAECEKHTEECVW